MQRPPTKGTGTRDPVDLPGVQALTLSGHSCGGTEGLREGDNRPTVPATVTGLRRQSSRSHRCQ